jgi:hypothetical protein
VVTRLVKINDLLDWVRENKKLPFPKEEHGQFFAKLKQIAKGTAKGFFSPEEIAALEEGLKTKNWASLTDKIFQKKIKEFLDPRVKWIDYTAPTTATPKPTHAPTTTAPKPTTAAPKPAPTELAPKPTTAAPAPKPSAPTPAPKASPSTTWLVTVTHSFLSSKREM